MREINKNKPNLIKGIGLGVMGVLAIHNILADIKLRKLYKSHGRFLRLITQTEEKRQKYEFEQDIRLELLESMMKDIYSDIEVYNDFEIIDGEEI